MKYKYGSRRRANEYEKALVLQWKKNKTFEKSVEMRSADNAYVFYDGPPFITGNPHHGTLLSSIVKDVVPRYWTMNGRRVERRWGWDCHGLPAENFVEKQLGITDRREIGTKWSLAEYITKARESMVANSETWENTIDRVGRWVNFKGAYKTMDKDFMESVWWAFKTLYDRGRIFEGRKVLMYDTKFATPVSKAEVTMDNDAYKEVTDPSAFVKFKVNFSSDLNRSFLDNSNFYALFSQLPASSFTSYAGTPAEPSASQTNLLGASGIYVKNEAGENVSKIMHNKLDNQVIESGASFYLLAWTTTPWTLPANMMLAVNEELEYGIYAIDNDYIIMAKSLAEKVLGEGVSEVGVVYGRDLVGLKYEPLFDLGEFNEATHKVYAGEFVSDADGTGIVHIAPAYGEDDYNLMLKTGADFIDVLDENGYYLPEVAEKLREIGVRDTDENGIEAWGGNKFIAKCLVENGKVWKIEYIKHEYPFNPRSKQRIMYRAIPSWFFDITTMKEELLKNNEEINWFPSHLKEGRFAKNIEQAPDWNLSRDRFWATAMPVWKGDKGTVKVVGSYDELYELSGVRLEDYHRPWVDEVEFEIDGEHFKRIDKVLDCWFESGSMPFAQMHYPFENKEKFEKNYPADFIVEYVGQVRAWFYYVHALNVALFGKSAYQNVITTGTLAGNDGRKMSKSLGNYTDPNELMDKYSADALRFLLVSSPVLSGEDFALLDKDVSDVARKLSMIWNVYDFFTMYAEVDGIDSEKMSFSGLNHFSTDTLRAALAESLRSVEKDLQLLSQLSNPLDRWIISRVWELRNVITEGMNEYNLPKATAEILPFIDDLSNWFVRRSRRRFWKSEDDNDKMSAYRTLHYVLVYLSKILAPFVPFLSEELYLKMTGGEEAESVHLVDWPEAGEIDEEVIDRMANLREIIKDGLALRMKKSETEAQIKVRQPLSKLVYSGEKLPEFYEKVIMEEVNVKNVEAGDEMWLDKEITEELKQEGFIRELIRVIQAGRKKAGLSVDDRIMLSVSCDMFGYDELIAEEVLAVEISKEGNYAYDEIVEVDGERVVISLEKA